MVCRLGLLVVIAGLSSFGCGPRDDWQSTGGGVTVVKTPAKPTANRDASDDFFESDHVRTFKITLLPEQEQKLREDARRYVPAKVTEDEKTIYPDVAIKLKGAAGSFQELDGKPAFTLNPGKFHKTQTIHDIDKLHLNNSVQDESYLCESIIADICRQVHVPAPRVTHARVWLGERDLGLYVVKEGFDDAFLKRHFAKPNGNLYEGGFVSDIDGEMERDTGEGPGDASDRIALVEACRQPIPAERWKQLTEHLNVDSFITFMAIELMSGHWDGYTVNRNNYRVYFEPPTNKAVFLPHGMDQLFQDPGFDTFPYPEMLVSSAVLSNPEWRSELKARVTKFLPLFKPQKINAHIDAVCKRLAPVLKSLGEEAVTNHADRVRELKERVAARYEVIKEHLARGDRMPEAFDDQPKQLTEFNQAQESEDPVFEMAEADGQTTFSIAVGPSNHCVASWRQRFLLVQGKYRFSAKVKTEKVAGFEGEPNQGAGLRISGSERENQLIGDHDWTPVEFVFEVLEPQREVELVAELRATAGKVWFASPIELSRITE